MARRMWSARVTAPSRSVAGQDGDEFLATIASREITALDVGFERHGDEAQHLVAGLVAPGVVEALEVIDVDQHQAQRLAAVARLAQQARDAVVEGLAVIDLGQRIEQGFAADILEVALQRLDIVARGGKAQLELVVGDLHAAGFRQQAVGDLAQAGGIEIVGREVAARHLQRGRIGARRGHGGVDGLVDGDHAPRHRSETPERRSCTSWDFRNSL